MKRLNKKQMRRGATMMEFTLVAPVTIFILIATMVGGVGVFRYQQTAWLAREAARYASTHGSNYASDTGKPAASVTDIQNFVAARAAAMASANLTTTVTWSNKNNTNPGNSPYTVSFDPVTGVTTVVNNNVTVTVSYNWMPEMFLAGPINLQSSCTTAMNY